MAYKSKKRIAIIALSALVMTLSSVFVGGAPVWAATTRISVIVHSADEQPSNGIYRLRSALNTEKVIDVAGGSEESKANVQLYSDNETAAQKFVIRSVEYGVYEVENLRSQKLLDAEWGGTTSQTNVWQYEDNDTCSQRWTMVRDSEGFYSFTSRCNPNLNIDVAWGEDRDGANIWLYEANDTASQKFKLDLVEEISDSQVIADGVYNIQTSLDNSKTLDVAWGSVDSGANIWIYDVNDTPAQSFKVSYVGDGFYQVVNMNSDKALDLSGGDSYNGANVWQYDQNGTIAQEWFIKQSVDGHYYVFTRCNMKAMDVSGGSSEPMTNVQVWENNETLAQKFDFVPVE